MATEWIKWTHGLESKEEVLALAAKLNVPPLHAAACCMALWVWFDKNTYNGHALSVTRLSLDGVVGVPGFVAAMISIGWLKDDGQRLSVVGWAKHHSQTAKERALASSRKQRQRVGHKRDTKRDQNGTIEVEVEVERELTTNNSPSDTLPREADAVVAAVPEQQPPAKAEVAPEPLPPAAVPEPAPKPAPPSAPATATATTPPSSAAPPPPEVSGKPEQPKKPRKDQWALDFFPTLQAVWPGATYQAGMPLLSSLAQSYTQPTVKAVVQAMLAAGETINHGGPQPYRILSARCQELNRVPLTSRVPGRGADRTPHPVSAEFANPPGHDYTRKDRRVY